MVKALVRRYRIWQLKRRFNRLPEAEQKAFRFLKIDPDSLIMRGKI